MDRVYAIEPDAEELLSTNPHGFGVCAQRYLSGTMAKFVPSLHVLETRGRVRITMPGITYGSGQTLQDAADELVRKVLVIALALRTGTAALSGPELRLDPAIQEFIRELAGIAARGDDIRGRLFGSSLTV